MRSVLDVCFCTPDTVVAELLTELRSDKIDLLLVGVETTEMDVIKVPYLSSYHS